MSKTAFVLSGGGAKGAFEVGVLKNLAIQGIVPDVLYGTSTGALNAAGYSYLGVDSLVNVWRSIRSRRDIMKLHFPLLLPFYLAWGKGRGLFHMKPLEQKINDMLKNRPTLESVVCEVSLKTSEKRFVRSSPTNPNTQAFSRAILASASTPVLNDVIDGEWVDGGVRQITPLQVAIDDGATNIVVILAEPFQQNVTFNGIMKDVLDAGTRTIGCMIQEMFWQDIMSASDRTHASITVYAPLTSPMGAMQFDPDVIGRVINLGLSATPVYRTS